MISVVLFPTQSNVVFPSGRINHKATTQKKHNNITMITKTLAAATLLMMGLFMGTVGATSETSGRPTLGHSNWAQNEPARFYISKYETVAAQLNHQKFIGNQSDYFKILHQDGDTILVGGKNALYNLSISTLQEQAHTRIEWTATDAHRQLCMLKGKSEHECQNYIRVYGKTSEHQFLLCGTNAYKPQCREYNTHRMGRSARHQQELGQGEGEEADGNEAVSEDAPIAVDYDNEEEAQGRCPYNPQHSSSYVFAGKNSILRGVPIEGPFVGFTSVSFVSSSFCTFPTHNNNDDALI